MNAAPREIIVLGPGMHTLEASDYPWLVALRVTLRGGSSSDGNRGESISQLFPRPQDRLTFLAAHNGGYAIVELYDREPTS